MNLVNLAGAPVRSDAEGIYTSQAWLIDTFGRLSHYTYWTDHPQLGWLQLAGYAQWTNAFGRWDAAILAGREFMVVLTLVSVVLVWALGRRMRLSRPAAAAAALIFAISPLAVQLHRTVSLDNIAVPWLLLAFFLAMSRRAQLAAFIGSAAAFGIAVLSKETFLLALPILAWVLVRASRKESRLHTLGAAAGTFAVIVGGYLLLSSLANRFADDPTRSSATDGFGFQTNTQAGAGSVLDPGSLLSGTLGSWAQVDPILLAVALGASVAGVLLYRTRPSAVFVLAGAAFVFIPWVYVPATFVVMLIPFAALVIAGVADAAVAWIRARGLRRSSAAFAAIAFVAVGAVVAVPVWAIMLTGLVASDAQQPQRAATQWLIDNAARSDRLIVGDVLWTDLVRAGWNRDDVVRYDEVDADATAGPQVGWRDADYVVSTDAVRSSRDAFPQAAQAIDNSVVVASFGTGSQAVEVRRISPDEAATASAAETEAAATRARFGAELAQNPGVIISDADRALLVDGLIDPRIAVVLAALAASGDVTVAGFPAIDGEDGQALRQVALTDMAGDPLVADGKLTTAAYALVGGLRDSFAPEDVAIDGDQLVLRYPFSVDPELG